MKCAHAFMCEMCNHNKKIIEKDFSRLKTSKNDVAPSFTIDTFEYLLIW